MLQTSRKRERFRRGHRGKEFRAAEEYRHGFSATEKKPDNHL